MKNMVTFKKRTAGTTGQVLLSRLLAVLASMIIIAIFIIISLDDKTKFAECMKRLYINPFFTGRGFLRTLGTAVPLMIASYGICVAFKMKLWNIGGEGQITIGAICAAGVAFYFPNMGYALMPLMIIAAILGGAIWAGICAVPRAFLRVNETITSLMLNYVAILLCQFLYLNTWRDVTAKGFPTTPRLPEQAVLPIFDGTNITYAIFIAIVVAGFYYLLINKSKWGYEVRVIGDSVDAPRYAGISVNKNTLLVLLISGAIAGLAGYALLAGQGGASKLTIGVASGFGFTAIIVAWLSRLNTLGVVMMALFMTGIVFGGNTLQTFGLSSSLTDVMQGIILFFVLGFDLLTRYKISINLPKKSTKESEV